AINVAAVVRRLGSHRAVFVLIALVAAGVLIDVVRRISFVGLLPSLATATVFLVWVALVGRFCGVEGLWAGPVAVAAVVAGAAFLFLFVQVATALVASLAPVLALPTSAINPFYTILSVSLALLLLATGLSLIARWRSGTGGKASAAGFFLTVMALLVIAL